MQFFEQTCNFHWDDLRLPTAEALVQGLSNIRAARVCCNLSSRHVLLVREASEFRIVFTNFDYANVDCDEDVRNDEMKAILGAIKKYMVHF